MLAGLVHTPVARALSWALIHFLWEGAAVAALLAAALFVFRPASARVRYGLACVALCTMLAAAGATLGILWPRAHADAGVVIRSGLPHAADASPAPMPDPPPALPPDRLPWVAPLWMVGVLLFYLRTAASWAAAERLRRRGTIPASADWQDRLRALARRLRVSRPVAMLESCLAETPAVVGFLRPAILIPAGLLTGLAPEQVEAILLHELAHIRRHDYAVNVLQTLVEGLLFYHPAVWWVSGLIRAERENCCDDVVVAAVGDARGYAAALAALERRRSVGEPALAARGGNLVRRIHRLLEPEGPRSIAGPILGATLLVVSIAAGLMAWQPPARQARPPVSAPTAIPNVVAQEKPTLLAQAREGTAQETQLRTQFATPYEKWLAEDVAYIATPEEKAVFQRLQTDAEREMFIEQFWLKRDPTPGTAANEFKQEHYRRIAYVNEHFAAGIPGWKTDRGRIYIRYGPPDEIDDHSSSAYTRPTEEGGGNTPSFPYVRWRYRHIEGVGDNIVIEFVDPTRSKEFRMTMDPSEKDALFGIPGPAKPAAAAQPQSSSPNQALIDLDNAIRAIQMNLAALREVFVDQHPYIVRSQAQLKVLQARREQVQAQSAPSAARQLRGAYADAPVPATGYVIGAPAAGAPSGNTLSDVPRRLHVDIQGLSAEATADLSRRLALREGETLDHAAFVKELERIHQIVSEFDPHLNDSRMLANVPRKVGADGKALPPDSTDATLIISPRDSAPNVGSAEAPAIKTGYLIGAGDTLSVMVFGVKDYSGQYEVRPDGRISMPFLGDVPAAGRTPEELGKDLAERLRAWVKSPRVSVLLMAVKSKKYYINGAVLKPGEYDLSVPTTVMEGLVQSGGFTDFANRKDIRILRNGGKDVLSFNFQEMLRGQRPEQNVLLEPGDIIAVK